jgi:hypothetical protein
MPRWELRVRMSTGFEDPPASIGYFLRAFGRSMKLDSCALNRLTASCHMRKHCVVTATSTSTTNARGSALGMKLRYNFLAFAGDAEYSTVLR